MHRSVPRGRRRHRVAFVGLFIASVVGTAAFAEPTRLFVFGAKPNATFEVRKNSTLVATTTSSHLGSVSADVAFVPGDRFDVEGPVATPPVPPLFASLSGENPGCATAAWLPSGDPTVVGYVLSFGTQSVAGGETLRYEQAIEVGTSTLHTECVLPTGTYYFAVQARSADGVMSSYSSERSILIQALAVLIAGFEAAVADEGVRLSWRVDADEPVQGFSVYRGEGTASPVQLTDELIDAAATSFVDATPRAGTAYTYILAAIKENGDEVLSIPASVTTPALALALGQNYPNPFNPTTKIPFVLEREGRVLVRVFDIRGSLVATVFDGTLGEGRHSIEWSGRDQRGQPVASGLYLYQLTSGNRSMSKKMMMVK
jgi:hypothetical protein